jgi:hypothetical protein
MVDGGFRTRLASVTTDGLRETRWHAGERALALTVRS